MPQQRWYRRWTTWQPAARTAWIVVAIVGTFSVLLISVALVSSGTSSPTLAIGSGLSQIGSGTVPSTSTTEPVQSQVGPGTGSSGTGTSGSGTSGSGTSGSGTSGSGTSGSGTSGTGTSGTGTSGSGTSGSGSSGSGTSGSGTSGTGTSSSGTSGSGTGTGAATNQAVGMSNAPAGEDAAIEAGVSNPPGPVTSGRARQVGPHLRDRPVRGQSDNARLAPPERIGMGHTGPGLAPTAMCERLARRCRIGPTGMDASLRVTLSPYG